MYKVVLVDDDASIVNGLARLLPWEKYECQVVGMASNGKEALEIIGNNPPHILFTDIGMPKMDGLSLIAAAKSEFPNMQIAILSGHADFEYAQRAIRLGVSRYLLKPAKMNELEEALCQMVATWKSLKAKEENLHADDDSTGNFIIDNAINYIEAHYAEKLSLPDVAEKVYVSQWHLSKLIAIYTGQSFSEVLNGVRIRRAKELLKDPSLKIREISEKVGFLHVTHFSHVFKKLERQSANEYRHKHFS